MVGLAAHALIAILARAFYARQDTRTPVAAAILAVVINSSLAFAFVGPLGLPGLALAIAVAAWVEAIVLVWLLKQRLDGLDVGALVRVGVEAAIGTAIAAALGLFAMGLIEARIGRAPGRIALTAEGIAVAGVFALAYLGVSLALRIPELPTIVGVVVDLARRAAGRRP